jgi:hypothetical protein
MQDKPHKFGFELLCCAVIWALCCAVGFGHRTEIYSGQENDPKFWKNEEPDMVASGSLVI